ncbi:hypothetical protein EHQ92_18030 [Leptospira biflexa]|uniref:hypothetical protein n=1 Tax=Leptospira biflexa TaxID=172 RepID=UPI0010913E32|nr:hypothetical protein [Leptospira biflexa]TGM41697.1 hypothetical protein EHQ92_18030 [Leptospira biflexa]TGM43890.1 hypothetical protein EHQ88_18130 [Leptospira biflexa]
MNKLKLQAKMESNVKEHHPEQMISHKAREFDSIVESSKLLNYRKVFLYFRTNPSDSKKGIKHPILEKAVNRVFKKMESLIFSYSINHNNRTKNQPINACFPRIGFRLKHEYGDNQPFIGVICYIPEHHIFLLEGYFAREFATYSVKTNSFHGTRTIIEKEIFECPTINFLMQHWLFDSENFLNIPKQSFRESLSMVSFSSANNETDNLNFDSDEFQCHKLLNDSIHERVNGERDYKDDIIMDRLEALFS